MAAADGADAVVLATAWPEYLALDWAAMARVMARPLVIDTRNALDADSVIAAGCEYRCVGRPAREGNAANATLMLGAAAGG
jgi:UDPglucose 6-dehydrogenase